MISIEFGHSTLLEIDLLDHDKHHHQVVHMEEIEKHNHIIIHKPLRCLKPRLFSTQILTTPVPTFFHVSLHSLLDVMEEPTDIVAAIIIQYKQAISFNETAFIMHKHGPLQKQSSCII